MEIASYLEERGIIKKKNIVRAFSRVDRKDFVPEQEKDHAYRDMALPIGYGQTISQPQVVGFMLELLAPEEGQKIMDVGFGSGWTTALLAEAVGEGRVVSLEIVPEVYEFGVKNISKYNFLKKGVVKVFCKDGREGMPEEAPFDGILVSAAEQKELPRALYEQLKIGGRIVIPIGSSVFLFIKNDKKWEKREYPGFSFVPLR